MADLTRRALLARAGVAAGAMALGSAEPLEASPDLTDWRAVRGQFALDPGRVHLTSFLLACAPAAREDRRSSVTGAASTRTRSVPARERGAPDRESPRYGWAVPRRACPGGRPHRLDDDGPRPPLHGTALRPADEVLTTSHDFYATHESLRLSRARSGASPSTTTHGRRPWTRS